MNSTSSRTMIYALLLSGLVHGALLLNISTQDEQLTPEYQSSRIDVELVTKKPVMPAAGQNDQPENRQAKYQLHPIPSAESFFENNAAQVNATDVATEQAVNAPVASSATTESHAQFVSLLHQAIDSRKHYPYQAQRQRREGRVKLTFVVHPDGHVTDVLVVASSQFDALDAAARDAVNAISPFQLAANYINQPNVFDVDLDFRLN